MMYLWLLLGFVFLVKGADLFVDGCSSIAKTLRVPSIIIGLTIVAFGTSAPEASVSIMASLSGNNDIAISNVIGSNLFNSLAVIGVWRCGPPHENTGRPAEKGDALFYSGHRIAAFILHVFHWRRKGSSADRTPGGAGSASVVRGISVYADQVSTEDPHHPA
mgnify:CR=1 FL=1